MLSLRKLIMARLAVLVMSSCGLLLWSVPTALAAGPFRSLSSFGGTGSGSGQFQEPWGAAVEESTGDVFIADLGNKRVEKFNPAGTVVESEITGTATPAPEFEKEPLGVAVDNSGDSHKGDVYVAVDDESSGVFAVDRFKPKGTSGSEPNEYEYECQFTGPERGCFHNPATEAPPGATFTEGQAVAVDSNGNVYIAAEDGVYEFEANGDSVAPSAGKPLHNFTFDTFSVAVSGNDVYAITVGEDFTFELVRLVVNPTTHTVEQETALDTENAHAVTIDPNGDVYVVNEQATGESHVAVYASTAAAGSTPIEEFGANEIGEAHGLTYSNQSNGKLYIVESAGNHVHIFERSPAGKTEPDITDCKATGVTPVTELLSCILAPNGEALTYFGYGTGGPPLRGLFEETTPRTVTSPEPFDEEIHGLHPSSEYTFKVIAKNEAGTEIGEEVSFTTLPAVAGVAVCKARIVAAEAATAEASFEGQANTSTKYRFQYGTSLSYGLESEAQSSESGGMVDAQISLTALEPNTTYDCRLTATRKIEGSAYTTYGANGTFTTGALPPKIVSELTTNIASTSAQVRATIDPENSATTCLFQYVAAVDYHPEAADPYSEGAIEPVGEAYVGSDDAYHTVQQALGGFKPGTTYHYRVIATNSPGEPGTGTTVGEDQTFTTAGTNAPVVSTGPVGGVTQTEATLSGSVNPEGYATSYVFEIGATINGDGAVEYTTDISGAVGDTGMQPQDVTLALVNLAPLTTYYYRLSAMNTNGTSYGQPIAFATPGLSYLLALPLALPLLSNPAIAFPTEASTTTTKTTTKTLTRAQKLTAALKSCSKKPNGRKRAKCEKQVRKKFKKKK